MARRKPDVNNRHDFKNGKLQNDNLFVSPELLSVSELTGLETVSMIDQLLVITDPKTGVRKAVNSVSSDYGLLANEVFIPAIEERLAGAGINFARRAIARNNTAFAVDYILEDDSYHANVKNNRDIIKPMIRVLNSYDGSSQTEGHFGFFRQVCSNGLHVAEAELKFKIRHSGKIVELTIPKIEELIAAFMDNEYYSLHKKFKVLSESPITDLEGFVKYTLGKTGLFKYSKSEKNPNEPSIGAQFIIDTIKNEAAAIQSTPNLWLGYNAFNEYIHTQNQRAFMLQERSDRQIFKAIEEQAN